MLFIWHRDCITMSEADTTQKVCMPFSMADIEHSRNDMKQGKG